jgi:hypothetical protein
MAEPIPSDHPADGEESEPPLTSWGRLTAVFTSPGQAFRDLARRPRWLAAFLIVLAVGLGTSQAIHPLVIQMQHDMALQNPRLTPEQADRAIRGMRFMEGGLGRLITGGGVVIATVLGLLITAAVLLFGGNFLLGGESDFRTLFAVTCHVQLIGLAKAVLTVPLMLAKQSMYVATSLQVLLPVEQWRRPAGLLLGGVSDVFTLWMVGLTILGVAAAYKWKTGRSAALVIALYLVWLLGSTGLAALFGGMGA